MATEKDKAKKETLGFQTEVTQLLDLMVHSLYSHKESDVCVLWGV